MTCFLLQVPSSHCLKTLSLLVMLLYRPGGVNYGPLCCSEEGVHVLLALRSSEKATTCYASNSLHDCMVGSAHAFLFLFFFANAFYSSICFCWHASLLWSARISHYLLFAKKISDVYGAPSWYKQVFGPCIAQQSLSQDSVGWATVTLC